MVTIPLTVRNRTLTHDFARRHLSNLCNRLKHDILHCYSDVSGLRNHPDKSCVNKAEGMITWAVIALSTDVTFSQNPIHD